jgi:hypothetical protein
MFVGTAWYAK